MILALLRFYSCFLIQVEDAGGKCLPCVVDIREESAVHKAVEEGVQTYGGIDILINNASAISLTGTLQTPMKRYANDIVIVFCFGFLPLCNFTFI